MRILLVYPDCGSVDFGFRLAALPEPLGLEILAATLPEHETAIADLRCGDDLAATVRAFRPDVVGVTALTPDVYAAHDVVRQVKAISPEIITLVGGHHATLLPEDFHLPEVDVIILGEGDLVLPALIAALEARSDLAKIPNLSYRRPDGTFCATPRTHGVTALDSVAMPRRDLVERHRAKYFFLFDQPDSSMATGRGCPYRCNFCSVWEFYEGRTGMMSPQRVLKELRTIQTDHVTFVDDNFLLHYKRENEIADMIRAEGIKKRYGFECRTDAIVRHPELVKKWADLGLWGMLLGLEGSDTMLESVGKSNTLKTNDEAIRICDDLGLLIWGAFIVDPMWGVDDFKRLSDYVRSKKITSTQYTVLTPLPGTELYRQSQDRLLTHDYSCFDALHAVVETKLPREEFYRQYAALYQHQEYDVDIYMNLLRSGKLTPAHLKRGQRMLKAMGNWENYAKNDPILRDKVRS